MWLQSVTLINLPISSVILLVNNFIEIAKRIVDIFIETPFDGGRHKVRVEMYESDE